MRSLISKVLEMDIVKGYHNSGNTLSVPTCTSKEENSKQVLFNVCFAIQIEHLT